MEKLVLIDGNSLLNRAFYATPLFTTKSGVPTNAVFGFVKLMLKIISDKKPSEEAVSCEATLEDLYLYYFPTEEGVQ